MNNLNDGLAWGILPVLFAVDGLSVGYVGLLAALYPAVWGAGQFVTGTLSDRVGRKPLIVAGMWNQAVALGVFAAGTGMVPWVFAAVGLGIGTALVYPTLLATIADIAHPNWRASAVGVYRPWRTAGTPWCPGSRHQRRPHRPSGSGGHRRRPHGGQWARSAPDAGRNTSAIRQWWCEPELLRDWSWTATSTNGSQPTWSRVGGR